MKTYFFLFVFFIFVSSVFSQSGKVSRCSFQFRTYPFSATKEEFPTSLKDAKVVLKNEKTKRIINAKDQATHLFTQLPEGNYELSASHPAYQTTTQKVGIVCPQTNAVEPASQIIFLWENGEKRPEQIYLATRGVYKIGHPESTNVQRAINSKEDEELINRKVRRLVQPKYPAAAQAIRASGTVNVQVTIDELGFVISAKAVSGHPLLHNVSERAAFESRFKTTTLSGMPVKVTGIIVYNFSTQ